MSTLAQLYPVSTQSTNGVVVHFCSGEVRSVYSHLNIGMMLTRERIAVGMTVAQLIVAVVGTTTTGQLPDGTVYATNLSGQKASIAFVCIYIFFFASTWGPIAWFVSLSSHPLHPPQPSIKPTQDMTRTLTHPTPPGSSRARSSPSKSAPKPSP